MGLIYSTVNEGIAFQPVMIPFTQGTVIVSPEIVLANLVLAYAKEDIDNILAKNKALDNPTVPDPDAPTTTTTCSCDVCTTFDVSEDENDPDALVISIKGDSDNNDDGQVTP